MQYVDIQIDPQSAHRPQPVLSFTAVTVTRGGQRIEARIVIDPGELHDQMVKATKNRRFASTRGALTVKTLSH